MCMIESADPWKLYQESARVARKSWRCIECGRTILPGEHYHHATGLEDGHDGRWRQMRQCAHCRAAAEWLAVVCGGWVYGEVHEDLREHWGEYPSRELARLTVGIKTEWHAGQDPVPDWAGNAASSAMEAERQRVQAGLRVVAS